MAQGAEILHGQGVVGTLQKGGGSIVQQGCGGSLTTGGEGQARLRRGGKVIGKGGAVQAVGQTPQGGQIPTLAAEQEGIGPGKGQQPQPPRAKVSAGDMAQGVGSSSTRSAPQRTAISARAVLDRAAKLPAG